MVIKVKLRVKILQAKHHYPVQCTMDHLDDYFGCQKPHHDDKNPGYKIIPRYEIYINKCE